MIIIHVVYICTIVQYQSVNKHDVACGFDGEEEFQDEDDDEMDEDIDSAVSENKWRVESEHNDQISEIHNKNKSDIEYTLAIIYPDTIKYQMFIEQIIIDEGFEICRKQILQMTPEQTSEFFIDKYGKLQFPRLIAYMSSSPIVIFVIAKYQAINDWLQLIGPEEVREMIRQKFVIKILFNKINCNFWRLEKQNYTIQIALELNMVIMNNLKMLFMEAVRMQQLKEKFDFFFLIVILYFNLLYFKYLHKYNKQHLFY